MAWTVCAQPSKGASSSDTAARVNGAAVTQLELNRLFLAHAQVPYSLVQEDPRAQEVRRQLLDLLIDRHLLLQEAKTLNMTVPQQELDEEFQGLIERFPSKEAFEETLKTEDLTPEAIRKNLGDQLLRQQLVRQEILEKVVEARKPARALSYDEAKDQVTEDVKRERTIARYQEYVGGLRGRAKIEVLLP